MYNYSRELEDSVKLQLIKEFIKSNKRTPTSGEINDLVFDVYQELKNIDSSGLIRMPTLPFLGEESSATIFNSKLNDYYFNAKFLFTQIDLFFQRLTERAFIVNNSLSSLEKRLRKLNSFATSLLLAKGISSNLLYSVTEDFSSTAKVISETTTASVSVSGVSINRASNATLSAVDSLSYSVFSQAGYESATTVNDISSILDNDGDFWTLDVLTSYKHGSVSAAIEVKLTELTYVSNLSLSLASSTNSHISCYVAGNDKSYSLVFNSGLDVNDFLININSSVLYIKLLVTKQSSDTNDSSGNYVYSFKVDSIELSESTVDSKSELYAGPYEFTDALGELVPFSFVQLAVCEQAATDSWIDYYLSSDNSTWIPVDASLTGGSIINFQINNVLSDLDILNADLPSTELESTNIAGLDLLPDESCINQIVDISYLNKISPSNILFKRNVKNTRTVFDISSGWIFDTTENLYVTTFEVVSEEGSTLDLGSTSAYLDGVLTSGTVLVPLGFHTFKTDQNNWADIEEGLSTESELQNKDPLYPYNHKYIISGYTYPSGFTGNKYYNGVYNNFGMILTYLSKPEFKTSTLLNVYTVDTDENNIYFLVKTLKGFDDWTNEEFAIEITLPSDEVTSIYLKAVLNSNDEISSCVLKNFTLRAG